MASKSYEGGIRPITLQFAREVDEAVAPTNPAFLNYSDNLRSFDPGVDPGVEGQRGLGGADFNDHFTGTGSYNFTIEYDLQKWFTTGGGTANDASYDGMARDTYARLPNSHTVVREMELGDLDAGNTVNGSTSKDSRMFIVYLGAKIDTVTVTGDPTSPQPVTITLEYLARKGEVHQLDQPGSSTALTVVSDVAGDSSQTLTIEDDAGVTEAVSLNGTTAATTAKTDWTTIKAAHLDAETEGVVTIAESGGDDLAEIRGSDSFDFSEGDLGVPDIGTGSRESAIGTAYEVVQGDTFERPSGTDLADAINSVEITIENNVSEDATTEGSRPIVVGNERVITAEATVFGENEYFQAMKDALTSTSGNLVWGMTGGNLQVDTAFVMEVGGEETPSQGIKSVDLTLEGESLTVSEA